MDSISASLALQDLTASASPPLAPERSDDRSFLDWTMNVRNVGSCCADTYLRRGALNDALDGLQLRAGGLHAGFGLRDGSDGEAGVPLQLGDDGGRLRPVLRPGNPLDGDARLSQHPHWDWSSSPCGPCWHPRPHQCPASSDWSDASHCWSTWSPRYWRSRHHWGSSPGSW